jgi:hypothetical protein
MAKSKMKRKRVPKSVLKLPDLEQSKSAVLNSLTSPSSQRTYDHAIREIMAASGIANGILLRSINKAGRDGVAPLAPRSSGA